MAKHSIFIGYRREDAPDACSRVYDALAPVFGPGAMFMDIDDMPYGRDFSEFVRTILPQCSVFLAMIGPRWLEAHDAAGARRLDDPEDLVRREIELALEAPDVQVIPVLLNGARIPSADALPPSLRPLAGLNAARIRREDFHDDIERLVTALKERVRTGATVTVDARARPTPLSAPRAVAPAASPTASNIVLVAGLPMRGKSVFLSHLARYLFKSGDFAVEVVGADQRARETLQGWRDDWRDNRLPRPTQAGAPIELGLEVRPSAGDRPTLRLTLFEDAGERAASLLRAGESVLPPALQDMVSAGNIRIVLVLACNAQFTEWDDELFAGILDDLRRIDHRALTRIPVLILVGDSSMTRARMRHGPHGQYEDGDSPSLDTAGAAFCKTYLPQTSARLSAEGIDARIVDFDVGDIGIDKDGERRIMRSRFDDVRSIFHWIYQKCTGVPLIRPALAERYLPKLASSQIVGMLFIAICTVCVAIFGWCVYLGFRSTLGSGLSIVTAMTVAACLFAASMALRHARLLGRSIAPPAGLLVLSSLFGVAPTAAYFSTMMSKSSRQPDLAEPIRLMIDAWQGGEYGLTLTAIALTLVVSWLPLFAALALFGPRPLPSVSRGPRAKARFERPPRRGERWGERR